MRLTNAAFDDGVEDFRMRHSRGFLSAFVKLKRAHRSPLFECVTLVARRLSMVRTSVLYWRSERRTH